MVGDNGDGVQHEQGSPFPSTCPNGFVAGNALSSFCNLNSHSLDAAPGYDVVSGLGSMDFTQLSSMLP